ncbi:hypothetical protein ACFQY0_12470 [Haloferula chungangensis]|uniref:Uncharacterized protein n=1 Tax=Haloferula chungangensis TaxID=1048331 RepID=A0ABW2L6H0_9BACT
MKQLLTILLAAAAASSLHAAPLDPARVPADAKWWLHLDLEGARQSEVGGRIAREITEREGAKLRAAERMFSINPLTDLAGFTLYGDGDEKNGVLIVEGRFDQAHLTDIVAAADDYATSEHAGTTVHSWKDKSKSQNAAFVGDRLLVFSQTKSTLHDAIDLLASGEGMQAETFATVGAPPVFIGSAKVAELPMKKDDAKLLRKAENLKIALGETGGQIEGRIELESDSAVTGKLVRKVLEGIVAIGRLTNEELADINPAFETRESEGGRVVSATLSMPASEMISLMEKNGDFDKIGK